MRGLLAGVVAVFGIVLGLDAYGYRDLPTASQVADVANADAAMTPDSAISELGTSGSGYGLQ